MHADGCAGPREKVIGLALESGNVATGELNGPSGCRERERRGAADVGGAAEDQNYCRG